MAELKNILKVMGYTKEESEIAINSIGSLRRIITITRDTLQANSEMNAGMIDELLCFKEWYTVWRSTDVSKTVAITEVFTEEEWDSFIMDKALEPARSIDVKEESGVASEQVKKEEGLNISYKVESKDIPKLPANKSLRGRIFDDWHAAFYVKMCQAKLRDILEDGYVAPDPSEDDYERFKVKDDYLKNHILTATLGSNANSFINVKTMDGIEMYKKLLDVFQGEEHEEDKAVNAASLFEKLKFNKDSRYSPETFLAKVNECLKRMEVEDGQGGTTRPVSNVLLPSIFRAKVNHPTYDTWKELSETNREDWDGIQVSFLRVAEKKFKPSHDTSDKFRSANQISESGAESGRLSVENRKAYQKACNEGKGVPNRIWKRLSKKEKDILMKARLEKKNKNNSDGGLGSQYSINQQLSSLPSGTVLVPITPQNQANDTSQDNAGDNGQGNSRSSNQETSEARAANFLQLANGNFVIRNVSFKLSSRVSGRMSVQSYQQRTNYKGTLWIDSGTNVSTMGRAFRMIQETGRFANMTGFANDLVKNNVPIGSGLTKCVDKRNGFEFLLGLHEAPYLETNEGSLLSTNQSREAGIWLADVLKRHGGDQRLVAPVENREDMLDMPLGVKDGLLAITCTYPSEKDMEELPRVWLTSNEVPWDPKILEEDDSVTVPSCWDGESEFMVATNMDVQEQESMDRFENYFLQRQKATTFMVQALGFVCMGTALYNVFNNIKERVVSASIALKNHDYEQMRPLLGWLPLEVVKRTIGCTTQLAMGSLISMPFKQHHKSRTPQLNVPRLAETFATDTLFSSEVGLGGITCAQLFVGTKSKLTKVFGMRTESEGPDALVDFIRDNGAPYALRSDNSKMQTGVSFKNILRKYNIKSENTEPHHPNQNPAERRIQDVKRTTTKILDRTGAPGYTWFFCMLYTVMLLNYTAVESIGWITPHQACFGVTPDISALLQYQFFQPVYFSDKDIFPEAEERLGHWLGVAENKGDTLTYWILAENKQVLARSLVRPVDDHEVNHRVEQTGEILDPAANEEENGDISLDLLSEIVNSPVPEIDPTTINGLFNAQDHIGLEFIKKDQRGVPTKTKVIEVDEDTGKVMLEYIHGGLEIVEPNIIQEALLSKDQGDDGDEYWTFSKVLNHRTVSNGKIEVEILWDNGEVSWEPLAVVRKDDPITLAGYARDRKLLDQRGWKWAKKIAKREKKFVRLLKLMKASKKYNKKSFGIKYKFGVIVPRTGDVRGAMQLDKENGNNLWFEAQMKEAFTLRDLDTFELMPDGFDLSGYQYVPLIYAWDVKFDGRRRARLVANGKVTIGPPEEEVWSGVVNTESVRTALFLGMLNGMKILAADISSAYLMADTKEKMFTKLGPEFGDWAGKTAIIKKALYGLIGSCAQFHRHLCVELSKLGFVPSKADQDLWMHDAGDHYEYIAKYIDDILIISKDPMTILNQLKKPKGPYDFKGVGSPEYYLGGDVKITYNGDSIEELSLSSKTYIKRICEKIETLMGWKLKGFMNPMDPNFHPEIDDSDFLTGEDISKYRMMVGSLNWLVTLGRYDIHYAVCTLARHMMMPRQAHMHAMRRVFGYLQQNYKFSIDYDVDEPDFSKYKIEEYDWFPLYGNVKEEESYGMPVSKGKSVVTSGFFDSSHASCLMTRRSTTCVLLFVNGTLIRWYSKRQNCVETSTYGSEIVAGRIAVDLVVELRYNLRMLGAPVKGTTILFGDNQSMVTNTSLPHSILKKRHSANNYHRVREAVAAGIVSIVHCDTKFNLADMGTKSLNGQTHQFLLQNQNLPPVSTAGECQLDTSTEKSEPNVVSNYARLVLHVLSLLDQEVVDSFHDQKFCSYLMKSFHE